MISNIITVQLTEIVRHFTKLLFVGIVTMRTHLKLFTTSSRSRDEGQAYRKDRLKVTMSGPQVLPV